MVTKQQPKVERMLLIFAMVSASRSELSCNFVMTMVYLLSKHNVQLKLENRKNAKANPPKNTMVIKKECKLRKRVAL